MRDTHAKTDTTARAETMLTLPVCAGLVRLSWQLCLVLDEDFIAEWHAVCHRIGDDLTCDRIAEEEHTLAQQLRDLGA